MQAFLDELEPRKREVFVLMQIEGMSAPQVARACGAKVPTVYTRLRAARQELEAFIDRAWTRDASRRDSPGRFRAAR